MGLGDDLREYAAATHSKQWSTRDGLKVPTPDDVGLGNVAVKLEGVVLYADLAESTGLVQGYKDWFAAEVYKNYLYAAGRIIRSNGGEITAYDGDRIMAVFIGDTKNSNATKAGLEINYAVTEILQPAMQSAYPKNTFVLKQRVGIDRSELFVARTGMRGRNELVWVGNAANLAAKMAALSLGYATYISQSVYDWLLDHVKYAANGTNIWTDLGVAAVGQRIYGSTWHFTMNA